MKYDSKIEVEQETVGSRDSYTIPYDPSFQEHFDFSELFDKKASKNSHFKWWPYAISLIVIASICILSKLSYEEFMKRDREQKVAEKKVETEIKNALDTTIPLFQQQIGQISNQLDSLTSIVNCINIKNKRKK